MASLNQHQEMVILVQLGILDEALSELETVKRALIAEKSELRYLLFDIMAEESGE